MDGLTYDDRSQAVILNKGTTVISKVNNEAIGIFKIGTFTITIEDHLGTETVRIIGISKDK